ncbi:MlaD family protein [Hymenobacter latericus]|uniref:MlaD family protein n=1 Tax=Hymenobacter sp. YIM 151858-1 TaxID=2987688 RepID=UPI002225D9DB|nr:MlaD family protein [Hymenobacter sp. YIM 151858-1]UYZ60872.1 MlaD family protein [Hymenobacter sp. YIM 151858-1]
MSQRTPGNHVRLGLFVLVGLGGLLVTLFLLGRQQNLFSRSLLVQADFRNVSGLLTGNNVRLGGIPVGTVRRIQIINDTTIRVTMRLNRDVQPYVRRNTVASIGTDGLVGNTIINLLAQPGPAPAVAPGDRLPTRVPLGIDDLLVTLQGSGQNLIGITQDMRAVTARLNNSEALWQLLSDEQLAANVRHSLRSAARAATSLETAAADVQRLTRQVRQGRGAAGYLLTDTSLVGNLAHTSRQLAGSSDTLAALLTTLQGQVHRGTGPLGTLLTDTAMSRQLRQSVEHVERGTAGFSRSMEALEHNFLVRGYLRRQRKKQAAAAPSDQAEPVK